MKTALVLGGGGFIGGHLSKRLKEEGTWVRIVDIKPSHEFFKSEDICNDYVCGDLTRQTVVEDAFKTPNNKPFDEVYQLAADMGGAGYIFTGEHDSQVMHNSIAINVNVVKQCVLSKIGRVFFSSSACMYPEHLQLDPNNPSLVESSAYPAQPDSEYGWEKLFSERMYLAFARNEGLTVRIARYHGIFGPQGDYNSGKEKSPAAMCRKAAESSDVVEVWGDGQQTRSFLYVDECVEGTLRLMRQNEFAGPVNIGSDKMLTLNDLASMAIKFSGKDLSIHNIYGQEFKDKYGFEVPLGVRGRNSDNTLIQEKLGWAPSAPLEDGLRKTYEWIKEELSKKD